MTPQQRRLAEIVAKLSYIEGRVVLSSGKESDYYYDMKITMGDPEGSFLIANLIMDKVAAIRPDFIIGIPTGGRDIASALTPISFVRNQPQRVVFMRKEAKGHGTKNLFEGLSPQESLRDKTLVATEDVATSGKSAIDAITIMRGQGAHIAYLISILDREEGAREACAAAGILFEGLVTHSQVQAVR
jgi:orotate phosphoribosyltransferase